MKITFIGTSDGYPEADRYCSCTVVTVNGKHYVIDAGVSLYSALLHSGLQPRDTAAIFITHMHGDHASGLVEFVDLMAWGNRDKLNTDIFVPTVRGKTALLSLAYAMDEAREVEINVYKEGKVFEDENVCVTAYRTGHGAATFGFLVEAEGRSVYFTGDMRGDIIDMPEFVYNETTDLIICESAHNRLHLIADKLNAMQTDKIIINHVASGHSVDDFTQCAPLMSKPFVMAFDGMTEEL